MREYIGKVVKLHISRGDKILFFLAKITKVTQDHIYFTDKFNHGYIYRKDQVLELNDNVNDNPN